MKVCKKTETATGVTFAFGEGEDATTRNVQFETFPDNVREWLQVKAISHVLGDSYAGAGGNPDVAIGLFDKKLAALVAGETHTRSGEGRGPSFTVLAEAVARIAEMPLADATAFIESLDEDNLAALKDDAAIKAAQSDIRAERALARAEAEKKAAEGKESILSTLLG